MATFGRAKGFKLYSRLLLTLCAHKSFHISGLKMEFIQIHSMDVGGDHLTKDKYLVNSPYNERDTSQ